MYGSDPLGLLSWRFLQDEAGYGASTDLLSHAIDLAHALVGPIRRLVGTRATTIVPSGRCRGRAKARTTVAARPVIPPAR